MRRRDFLPVLLGAAAVRAEAPRLRFCVFSKHLHFLDWRDTAAAAKEMGFDGVDLTVRKGGHVSPERVSDDLPAAAEIVRAAGLDLSMITTEIADLSTPHAKAVLETAAKIGVTHYRWDGFKYKDGLSLPAQLQEMAPRVRDLAAFNREHKLCAMYHTHSGAGRVGASQWDLWMLLKDLDRKHVSFNFDIAHATIEGGLGGWIHSTRLALPHMGGIAVKDFLWEKTGDGKWQVRWTPVGEGMVHLREFFRMVRGSGFDGPVQVHAEYEMGGADKGAKKITWTRQQVLAALKHDLDAARAAAGAA